MIEVPGVDERTTAVWSSLLAISEDWPQGWTLIGAQMVALHAFEAEKNPPRISVDADVLVNVRSIARATEQFSGFLQERGYHLEGINTEGVGHRFRKGMVVLDVLAPDGLQGADSRPITVPPARTVSVPGGTQALARSELVAISVSKKNGRVPRPNLLGAVLVKARAVEVDDVPDSQLRDLAFLFSLVRDPRTLASDLRRTERAWLRRRTELLDRHASPWRDLDTVDAENGHLAFRLLAGN